MYFTFPGIHLTEPSDLCPFLTYQLTTLYHLLETKYFLHHFDQLAASMRPRVLCQETVGRGQDQGQGRGQSPTTTINLNTIARQYSLQVPVQPNIATQTVTDG